MLNSVSNKLSKHFSWQVRSALRDIMKVFSGRLERIYLHSLVLKLLVLLCTALRKGSSSLILTLQKMMSHRARMALKIQMMKMVRMTRMIYPWAQVVKNDHQLISIIHHGKRRINQQRGLQITTKNRKTWQRSKSLRRLERFMTKNLCFFRQALEFQVSSLKQKNCITPTMHQRRLSSKKRLTTRVLVLMFRTLWLGLFLHLRIQRLQWTPIFHVQLFNSSTNLTLMIKPKLPELMNPISLSSNPCKNC